MSDRAFEAFEEWRRRRDEGSPNGSPLDPNAGVVAIDEIHFAMTPDRFAADFYLHMTRDELCRSCVHTRGAMIHKWRLMVNARRANRNAPADALQVEYRRLKETLESHYRSVEHVCSIYDLNKEERKYFRAMALGCALMQGQKQEKATTTPDGDMPF